MGKVTCANEVEPFDFCVLRNFRYVHLFAGCPTVFTMDMQVSYDSHVPSPIGNVLAAGFKPLQSPILKTANGLV